MALLDESNKAVEGAAPVSGGIPPNDPMAMEALTNLEKSRGSYSSMGRSALMGAGMGAQAAQGAMNPLTAFLQGASAGLQAPAQVFAQKQAQVKSTLDAVPFGVRFPELAAQPAYRALAGMPSAIALETVRGIAQDTAKIVEERKSRTQAIGEQGAEDRANKLWEMSIKGKDPAKYEDISAMAKDFRSLEPVQQFQLAKVAKEMIYQAPDDGAGDIMIMANYARMLNPQTRFSESNLDATDISSYVDKYTKGLYDKVISGKKLQADERMKIKAAALKAFNIRKNEYMQVANLWEEKATELGMDADFIVSDKGWEQKSIGGKTVMARPLPNGKWEVKP